MLKCSWGFVVIFLLGCSNSTSSKKNGPNTHNAQIDCEVGIIGGGISGVYLAYKLSSKYHEKICLFEKENSLGGRLTDEKLNHDSAIWVGTGARRVNSTQTSVLKLGKKLGIQFQTPETKSQLIHTNHRQGYNPDEFVVDFPGLIGPLDQNPSTSREDEIYALLLKEKAKAKNYSNLKSYIKGIAGDKAFEYLHTVSRFHGDFQYDISASNYLEVLEEEFKLSHINHYPVGGMSAFIRAMETQIRQRGVRIFLSAPVLEFHENSSGFDVKTPELQANVKNLVLATPPSSLHYIQGPLTKQIRNSPEYQALLPIPVVVINQWWESSWWNKVSPAPGMKGKSGHIWRAWSKDQCVNHIEIPQESYAAQGKVTRSVYSDDQYCVQYWKGLLENEGLTAVEQAVAAGLERMLNVKIPRPLKTSVHFWPAGWYYVRAGSNLSNSDIVQWSIEPLPGRKNLMLVGESYWVNRPGWSAGGYLSVDMLLQKRFK